jgi:NOL1/NOP2/sun family putative RNA methylase
MLKEEYLKQMQDLLKEEFPAYLQCMTMSAGRGFRVNTLKITDEQLQQLLPFAMNHTPFAAHGYQLPEQYELRSSLPYAAGLFYVQEPSASAAVTALDPQPGMMVLDLCAAPGSKSTQIAESLQNCGMLVANEINPKRARVLAENLEKCGAANAMVLNADPANIADAFPEAFDQVLCDAPCSGEGMFRKDPEAMTEWTPQSPSSCALRQRSILECAYRALKPGGTMVYSTCTFNLEENEHNMLWLLSAHSDLEVTDIPSGFGRPGLLPELRQARRIFPMDGGEGHFICRLRRREKEGRPFRPSALASERMPAAAEEALAHLLAESYPYKLIRKDHVYVSAAPFVSVGRCHMIRQGILAGTMYSGRFEPDHSLYMSSLSRFRNSAELDDAMAWKFLAGEEIPLMHEKGYLAACWHGYVLGFGKCDGRVLKNKYPKEYRIR